MNFLPRGETADFLITGHWSQKAYEEAATPLGITHGRRPRPRTRATVAWPYPSRSIFVRAPLTSPLASNETIHGIQWHTFPDVGNRPLVADMSSDILSRPFDATRFALIYAGRDGPGPAGVTVVLLRNSWLEKGCKHLPDEILRYATHSKTNSLYNTPPVFGVYGLAFGTPVDRRGRRIGGDVGSQRWESPDRLRVRSTGAGTFYCGHAEPAGLAR